MVKEYIATKGNNYKKIFNDDIIGQIVMTDYNKKTYSVDDVTWEETPESTFRMKDENISYVDYYKKVRITKVCDLLLNII